MSKKRKVFHKSKLKQHKQLARSGGRHASPLTLENDILKIILRSPKALTLVEISEQLPIESRIKKNIQKAFDTLNGSQILRKTGRNRFQISKRAPIYTGVLAQNPKGFGFVEVSSSQEKSPPLLRDPFISHSKMGNSLHGDKVLVRVLRTRRDNRPEAAIIDVLGKSPDTLCGTFVVRGKDLRVYPDDHRFPFTVQIVPTSVTSAQNGDAVKVKYQRGVISQKMLSGQIVEILGSPDKIDTQMQLVVEKFKLPHLFNKEILTETEGFEQPTHIPEKRRDLRHIDHITIDGETAKDFDDAVSVTRTDAGFQLYVSIADVSHFVQPGSALDTEAFARGTSVYFPGKVIPMLPETLSNDLCSLVPGEDRYTVTALLNFDNSGTLVDKDFFRSVILSKHRFTYTTVQQIVVNKDNDLCTQHQNFVQQLQWAKDLAAILRKQRFDRGSIDFNLSEPQFILTESGDVSDIKRAERNLAHQIIEEFMLAANEAVAAFLKENISTPLLRIHEPPDELKLKDFLTFTKTLGIKVPAFKNHPSWFAAVVNSVKETRYEYIINNLLLRSLSQARYSIADTGHFGLASLAYSHFTSPIRRYPDLIVHRQLLALIDSREENKKTPSFHAPMDIKEAAEFLSKRERTAVDAERDMNDRLKISYMKDRVGESFSAIISGVTENSLFVELEDLCISGAVPVEFLVDDYYIHDAKNFRLFGEITANIYQLGDTTTVMLVDVNPHKKQLTFKIIAE